MGDQKSLIAFLRSNIDEDEQKVRAASHACSWTVRALVGLDVNRQIIELCESAIEAGQIKPLSSWNDDAAGAEVGEVVLRLMAQPYADRPGYDSAWSVET